MPIPRKPKGKLGKSAASPSALDGEKRVLLERQRQIDAKIAALHRTINDANPSGYRIRGTTGLAGTVLTEPPSGKRQSGPRRPPKKVVLRAEKQEGRMQTFALLVVVVFLIGWAMYKYL